MSVLPHMVIRTLPIAPIFTSCHLMNAAQWEMYTVREMILELNAPLVSADLFRESRVERGGQGWIRVDRGGEG